MRISTLLGGITAAVLSFGVLPSAATAEPANTPPQVSTPDISAETPGQLVAGGHPASEKYDWMASLQRGGEHTCGASLIDQQWVLTAAHCVEGRQPAELNLRIGSPNHAAGGTEAGVKKIVEHPDYASQDPNADIALIKLDRPVPNKPVRIADSAGTSKTPSRIIGWGVTCPITGCGEPPQQLHELDTQVANPQQCALSSVDSNSEICTRSNQPLRNACFGDSGGPQLKGRPGQWRLTGVTSRLGSPVPVCGTAPSVYTDATTYQGWIHRTIASHTG